VSRSEQTPTDTITEALETMPAASPHDRRAQGRNVIYASTIVPPVAPVRVPVRKPRPSGL
jgi:hypothetical protein